jgi:hypothetical protein
VNILELTEDLIQEAIKIAKEHKDNFTGNMLKLKLHICLRLENQLLDEMVKRGIIAISYKPKYHITVF